jgi:hypothetical protein
MTNGRSDNSADTGARKASAISLGGTRTTSLPEPTRQVAGEKLEPEQLKCLIWSGYVYRNGDEHLLTDMGREALAQPGDYPRATR